MARGAYLMPKILNPMFKNDADNRLIKYAAEIEAYIAGLPTTERVIDFVQIKADILSMNLAGITAADITDEKIASIAAAKKILVID
jgi:hypothetical protein